MKVLVVEDEFYARKAMIRQIKKYDQDGLFEISEASNGEEGWEFCEKYKPELVLTDIRMPKMDGIKAGMKLRDWNIDYKIIMLTVREDRFRDAFKIGAFRFVSKPINEVEFCLAINDVIDAMSINRSVIAYRDNVAFEISQKDILYIDILEH